MLDSYHMFTVSRCEYESDLRSNEHHFSSSENLNKAWKKFRPVQDLNPWPLRYRCSALSQRSEFKSMQIFFFFTGLNFFQALFSALHLLTSWDIRYLRVFKLAIFVLTSLFAVQIYDFHIFTVEYQGVQQSWRERKVNHVKFGYYHYW